MENAIVQPLANLGNFIVNNFTDVTIHWARIFEHTFDCSTQNYTTHLQYEDKRGNKVTVPIYDERNTKFLTHYTITDLSDSKLSFENRNSSIGQVQSTVTVPAIRNLCGPPTNLKILKMQKPYLSDYKLPVYELSWNSPNNGSCKITSYTLFWCAYPEWMRDCRVSTSVLYIKFIEIRQKKGEFTWLYAHDNRTQSARKQ